MARIIRSFSETYGLLSRGRFAERVDLELQRVIDALEACPDEKGRASLIVALEITYVQGRVDIRPIVKSKLPEEKGFSGTPFWTFENGLSIEHPSQIDMFGPRDAGKPASSASA